MGRKRKTATSKDYDAVKARALSRSQAVSTAGREIGAIPAVANSSRKKEAMKNFERFCVNYFPNRFVMSWSDDHLKVIKKITDATVNGGLFALAMPRGSGKTTLCECAVIWSILTGRHRFTYLIGSCEDAAKSMLANIKSELSNNQLILEDFPEVVFPIHCLEGQVRRCQGQLHHGKATEITWGIDTIVMPTIPGSQSSGALIKVSGITGNLRGALKILKSGDSLRPSLVVLDDPQTDQSARSPSQCKHRLSILTGAVLGLAGPGKKISGIMPCTVIRRDDMADKILDSQAHPEWQGERTKMIYSFPSNDSLWSEYKKLLFEGLRLGDKGKAATEYYSLHREAMDEGAVIA